MSSPRRSEQRFSSRNGASPRTSSGNTSLNLAGRQLRKIEESEAGGGIEAAAKRRRRLYEHGLHSGPDVGLEEVAAQGGAVEAPHHDVGLDPGLAILHGDVPHQGKHLDLLVDTEAPVFAPGDVE